MLDELTPQTSPRTAGSEERADQPVKEIGIQQIGNPRRAHLAAPIDVVVDPLGDLVQTGACARPVGRACLVLWNAGCPSGVFPCVHGCAPSAGTKAGA